MSCDFETPVWEFGGKECVRAVGEDGVDGVADRAAPVFCVGIYLIFVEIASAYIPN